MKRFVAFLVIANILLLYGIHQVGAAVLPICLVDSFSADVSSQWVRSADVTNGARMEAWQDKGICGTAQRFDFDTTGWGCFMMKKTGGQTDWSCYSQLQFYAKGESGQKISVRFVDGYDNTYTADIVLLGNQWQLYALNFEMFTCQNWAENRDMSNVSHYGFQPRGGSGSFWVDEVLLCSASEGVYLTEVTAPVPGSVYAGCIPNPVAVLYNATAQATDTMVQYQVMDLYDHVVAEGEVFVETITPKEFRQVEIPLELSQYGYFTIVVSNGVSQASGTFSYVPLQDTSVRNTTQSRFGFCTHFDQIHTPNKLEMIEREFALIAATGCNFIRQDIIWDQVEPQKGVYDWSLYDRVVELAEQYGIELEFTLCYSAEWASSAPDGVSRPDLYPPANLEDFYSYVYQCVNRYGDQVKNWEMWNEPNLASFWKPEPDAAAYAALMETGYAAAKEANASVTVGSGGMSGLGRDFFRQLHALGALENMDVLIIHPYQPTDTETDGKLEQDLRELYSIAPNKELWVSEWGWNVNRQATLREQAEWTVKGYLLQNAMDIQKIGLYSFNIETDEGFGVNSSEIAGVTRPVYAAIAGMNNMLGNREYAGNLDQEGVRVFAFSAPGALPLLAIWSQEPSTISLSVEGTVTQFDLFGNGASLSPQEGNLVINTTPAPFFVHGAFDLSDAVPLYKVSISNERDEQARYNITERFEDTPALERVGGDFSTISADIVNQGYDGGACAQFVFQTKPTAQGTISGDYGFRFPVLNDQWVPAPGAQGSFSEAAAESTAISLWIRAPASVFDRRVTLVLQTKDERGNNRMDFSTSPLSLRRDGAWELLSLPLSAFTNQTGVGFDQLSNQELSSIAIPYKFAVRVSYADYLNLHSAPEQAQSTWLCLDDVMFERCIDYNDPCVYPIAVPANPANPQFVTCNLAGAENASIKLERQMIISNVSPEQIQFLTTTPPILTDVDAQRQYQSGAYASWESPGVVRVVAGNFIDYRDYPLVYQYSGPVTLSVMEQALIPGDMTLHFNVDTDTLLVGARLYIAAYCEDGRLSNVWSTVVSEGISALTVTIGQDTAYVNGFVWDDALVPLSNVVTLRK